MAQPSLRSALCRAWLFGAAALATPAVALADEPPFDSESEDRHILFDFEEPIELDHRLGEHLSFGLSLESEFTHEGNFNLDGSRNEDLTRLTPELAVGFGLDMGPHAAAFAEFHLERDIDFQAPGDEPDPELRLTIDEAYLTLMDILPGFSMQAGRARIRDRRQWLLDQELDGLRAFLRVQDFGLELAANREGLFPVDLLNGDSITKINNYMAVLRYRPDEVFDARAYALHRDNREQDSDDLTFVGLQGIVDWPEGGGLWLDASYVFGHEEEAQVSGFGLDGGVTIVSESSFGLSATLALAFGSGDKNADDGKDKAFRQTGLQENRDGFNGVARFRYYGEVLQPELSNLFIATAGLGIYPMEQNSLDLVYHHYRQSRSADFLRDAAIDAEPDGRHSHIGDEIDLIFGIAEFDDIDLEAAAGIFFPGPAFGGDHDPAFVVRAEVNFEF